MSASAFTRSIPGYYFDPGTQFPGEKKLRYAKKNIKLEWSLLFLHKTFGGVE